MKVEENEVAILVRRARKRYGNDGKYILDGLDMTVKRGIIYGLLGASGCGKTTLLSTILGRKEVESGVVRVLGQPPGVLKTIGYMPQDIALVGEFTVKGALEHFGWIFGMTDEQIDVRYKFLSKLLDLPPAHKLIKHLSGGQQRRVSLAVVLVHDPELLILDEPTVGLDPVLRQDIWDYLVKITEENKTIIITTHYIEEAKQAHYIGLMRNGKILEEGRPQDLLDAYECSTIENVFVHLSQKQSEGKLTYGEEENAKYVIEEKQQQSEITQRKESKGLLSRLKFTNRGHAKALCTKNYHRFKRHPGTLTFSLGLPFVEICIFLLVIGSFPEDLKIGIINEEIGNYTNCDEYKLYNPVGGFLQDNQTCIYRGLACKFIDHMGAKLQNKVYFRTKGDALRAVQKGQVHHVLHFPYNFSKAVALVRDRELEFSDEDLETQEVKIFRDVIDPTLSMTIEKEIYSSYKRYAEGLALDCHTNTHYEKFPIVFNTPIYGKEDLTYRDFMAPGMLIITPSFLAIGLSSLTMITEKTEGIWDRTIVAGVSKAEILIFHTLSLACISFIQVSEVFVLTFYVFKLECKGEKLYVLFLTFLQSITGICYGILISVISRTVTEANYISLGLFYPFITMSGCVWPMEGMPQFLRYFSKIVPTTLPVEALSNIMHRGWGITHSLVLKGFLASIGFILSFTLISIIILRQEKK